MATTYADLLAAKVQVAAETGFPLVDQDDVNPLLKPHQRDAVLWAVRGGRRAIFASFGLGKTVIQLEAVRLTMASVGPAARGLIVLPLGVRQEFTRDAKMLGIEPPTFVRSHLDATTPGMYMTNYESIRIGKLDPTGFDVVTLDEAAILRGFGGTKTFRELMRLYEGSANYRFVATATPSPNDYLELLAYAAFLDILDVGQAKTRFFKRDSEHADQLTLLPHMEHEFWMWERRLDGVPLGLLVVPDQEVLARVRGRDELAHLRDPGGDARTLLRCRGLNAQGCVSEQLGPAVTVPLDLLDHRGRDLVPVHVDVREQVAVVGVAEVGRPVDEQRPRGDPDAVSVWGAQDLDARETSIIGFSDGDFPYLSTKPVIAGSGCNFQRHCHRAIFVGIGFKFADFIQSIHRIHRFGQTQPVRIDLIYTEAEAGIRAKLEKKWRNHEQLVDRMTSIVREHGLGADAIRGGLKRTGTPDRQEYSADAGDLEARLVLNDSVLEASSMETDSVGLIVTSIPFSTQYEYSPSVNDFGHNQDNAAFWAQMDFLTPELVRVLQPGRVAAIHVKDRIVPGGINGLGFRTLHPFHAEALAHYQRHGLAFLGMITVVTDVVRENNQTYRLAWTEQCKDGSSMGVGVPEYVLLLRKPQTDTSKGYADDRVVKDKDTYTLARWQVDAHGFWRSGGNRHLTPDDFAGLTHAEMFRLFRDHNLGNIYDFDDHVHLGAALREQGKLPVDFMLLQPPSWHPDVWTDVARMRTLNTAQAMKGKEQHLCPMPFDIVDRLIERWSNPGDTVLDPFGGIMTVPYCALKLGRSSVGIELNPIYWRDGVAHVKGIAEDLATPTLFDLVAAEQEAAS